MAQKKGAGQPAPSSSEPIKITPQSEHATRAAAIKRSLDAGAPKTPPPLPYANQRELGAMEKGERIPNDFPPQGAPDADWVWFDSLHSFETDLGLVIEPTGTHGWIALKAHPSYPPVLLYRLPLINRPETNNPF